MIRERMVNRPAHYNTRYKTDLSPREREILALVTKGSTNAEIASSLGLAFDTVKWHVSGILAKLGVDSREEAADYWRSYNSLGGRLGRAWSAIAALATSKAAVVSGASVAVFAAAALAAIAIYLSLNGNDRAVTTQQAQPEPRIGQSIQLPGSASMPLVSNGNSVFVPTSQGLVHFQPSGIPQLIVGTSPGPLGASPDGQIWTKGAGRHTLVQVDAATLTISRQVELPYPIDDTTFVFANSESVWVAFWANDALIRVDSVSGAVAAEVSVNRPKGAVLAGGFLWVALARSDAVAKLRPDTLEVIAEIRLGTIKESEGCGGCVSWVYAAGDSVWAISTAPGQATRIDTSTGTVAGTSLLPGKLLPSFVAEADGDAWLTVTPPGLSHGDVVRIDYLTFEEVERVPLGRGKALLDAVSPIGIAKLNDTLWIATEQGEFIPVRATP